MVPPYLKMLARLYGVERTYVDLWGKRHQASSEQIKTILELMGIVANSAKEATALIKEARHKKYQRVLPPVLVAKDVIKHLHIYIKDTELEQNHKWCLVLENGQKIEGMFQPSDLTRLSARNAGTENYYKLLFPWVHQLQHGYHRFMIAKLEDEYNQDNDLLIIVVPGKCYWPEDAKEKFRGIGVQLYSTRSKNNWGFGEFSDINKIVDYAAEKGADFIGLNPVHAVSLHNADYRSPYSPISRFQYNALNINVEEVAEEQGGVDLKEEIVSSYGKRIADLKEKYLIGYPEVRRLKLEAMSDLYEQFLKIHYGRKKTKLGSEFESYIQAGGDSLERYACYEALSEFFLNKDSKLIAWPMWEDCYQSPESKEVKVFSEDNRQRVDFYKYLQFYSERQLRSVASYVKDKGLALGLYIDLALSAERGGSDIWKDHDIYALGASVGCPADQYAPQGQNWSFPPVIPHQLVAHQYRYFIETLRVNMRYAGAIRIDHAMGLTRLFWIPPSGDALQGLYVRYPVQDMIGIISLESQRNKCVVVGEDLGTVPPGFRELMTDYNMLAYRVFFFMRTWGGGFEGPQVYPELSLVTGTTHDMHTLYGFWSGDDIELRESLGHIKEEDVAKEHETRKREKENLMRFLQSQGFLPDDYPLERGIDKLDDDVFIALEKFLCSVPSKMMMIPLEDIVGQVPQVNMPGVTDGYNSWSHRLPVNIEDLDRISRAQRLTL